MDYFKNVLNSADRDHISSCGHERHWKEQDQGRPFTGTSHHFNAKKCPICRFSTILSLSHQVPMVYMPGKGTSTVVLLLTNNSLLAEQYLIQTCVKLVA